jgi:hypothetical protein
MTFTVTHDKLEDVEKFIQSKGAKIDGSEVRYHGAIFNFTYDSTSQTVRVDVLKYPILVSHAYVDSHIGDLFTKPLNG